MVSRRVSSDLFVTLTDLGSDLVFDQCVRHEENEARSHQEIEIPRNKSSLGP